MNKKVKEMTFMKKITAVIIAGSLCTLAIAARAVTDAAIKNTQYIGEAKAKEIALEKAGLSQNDVTFKKTTLDRDDGVYVYEVEFRSADAKYEADVNAKDGTVVKFEQEGKVNRNKKAANNSELITEENAKAKALEKAGISEAEANFTKTKLEKDDGLYVYEFEFTAGSTKYDIDINAVTGETVKFETEEKKVKTDKKENPAKKQNTEQVKTENAYIGEDKALETVLEKAGLTEAEISHTKVKLDRDDGIYVYEVEFRNGRTEYEAEVRATDGKILSFEKDIDD